jgi:signal transduction histidine kinase/AraC-like DNA-binding protein
VLDHSRVGEERDEDAFYLKQLETCAAISLRIGGLLDLRALARELRRMVERGYGYDQLYLYVWSAADGCFRRQPHGSAANHNTRIPLAESGLLGKVLRDDAPLLVADTNRAILPIHFGGRVVGVLDLHGRGRIVHHRAELIGLQQVADQVGVALHNCELYAQALKARRQAEDADRLKTRLLANVSHELRAPLNVILGYSEAALAAPNSGARELPPGLRRDLEHIYTSGDHLMRLINDLLDLSRAEVGALDVFPEAVVPRAFLEEVFEQASRHAGARPEVAWRLNLAPHLPVIQADPGRLRQVLDNLLNNARAWTTAGEIELGAEVDEPHLHVWVRDTGEGIPAELQQRIFEPFVSGDRSGRRRGGIGLGLSITLRLVGLHGGTLLLDSEPGRGSTFHVRLPLPAEDVTCPGSVSVLTKPVGSEAVKGAIEALQPHPARQTGGVVIVDDDPQARALYSRLVREALPHSTIVTADNGAAAVQLIHQQQEPPMLVILDLVLPELDGFGVLERLRADQLTRHVPVLVVSGRLLSHTDVRRLDHARVLYQAKNLLSPTEALEVLQGAAAGFALLPQSTSAVVKQAMAYLHEHYSRSFARHHLAKTVGVSENYLSQIFHRELGLSPREYLSRIRIHKAKQLLTNTDESVTSVAGRVGFEDPAYFSRVFHKLVGESPQSYRQKK